MGPMGMGPMGMGPMGMGGSMGGSMGMGPMGNSNNNDCNGMRFGNGNGHGCCGCCCPQKNMEPRVEVVEKEIVREVKVDVIKEVPKEVIKYVEVEVPVEVIREQVKTIEVPVEVIVEKKVEVEKKVNVEVPVQIIREVPVEVVKERECNCCAQTGCQGGGGQGGMMLPPWQQCQVIDVPMPISDHAYAPPPMAMEPARIVDDAVGIGHTREVVREVPYEVVREVPKDVPIEVVREGGERDVPYWQRGDWEREIEERKERRRHDAGLARQPRPYRLQDRGGGYAPPRSAPGFRSSYSGSVKPLYGNSGHNSGAGGMLRGQPWNDASSRSRFPSVDHRR